jgi:hypothetical protein
MIEQDKAAMLHFIYNSRVVSVLVCHDVQEGNFVLQVPYFPPVESIEDYKLNSKRCHQLILDSLIGDQDNNVFTRQ